MSKTLKQKLVAYALVLPAFLVVMLTVAYPIVSAVIQSFQDEKTGEFTLANYAYFFTEPAQRMNILYTLFVVVATVVIALVVAYLLALYLRFVHSGIAKSIGTLYLLPRFVPAMCAVYAMITIIRDSGLINRIGLHFGMNLKLGLMYHANGMILMNLWFNIPFAAMMITAGLGAIPDSIIEAARIHDQRRFVHYPVPDGRQLPEDAGYRAVRPVQQVSGLQPFGRAVGHHVPALLGFRRRVYLHQPQGEGLGAVKSLRFIGGFKSPLYFFAGSEETGKKYPNDAAPGGWVEGQKPRYTPPVFANLLHRFYLMRAAARGTKFPWEISVRGALGCLCAGRFAAEGRVFLWKTWQIQLFPLKSA